MGASAAALLIGRGSASARDTPAASSPGAGMATPSSADFRAANLIAPARLQEQLDGANPPALIALTDANSFAAAHLDGASQIDWPAVEVTDTSDASIAAWRRHVETILGGFGVTPGRPVAIYDGGTLFAARIWWLLDYLGHDAKTILDGGLPAWQAAGLPVVGSTPPPGAGTPDIATPLSATPYPDHPVPARLATKTQVLAALNDPAVVVVDARKPDEFAAGHIPGAVNVNYPRNAQPNDPKTYLPTDQLLALYAAAGVTPDRHVIPYCSTGVRSAVTYAALRLAGFPSVSLYTGSWNEWGPDPSTPKQTGA